MAEESASPEAPIGLLDEIAVGYVFGMSYVWLHARVSDYEPVPYRGPIMGGVWISVELVPKNAAQVLPTA